MQKYETLIALVPTLSEEEIKALIERISAIIAKDGNVEEISEWGIKKLAYKIANKYTEGYYILINFTASNEVLKELNHVYRITENIIRDIVVKKEQ